MTQFDRRGAGQLGEADPFAVWDAAYVLGSLDAEERRQYEAHLSTCAPCREAVAQLAGMPALLALLDPDEVASLDEASPELPQPPAELLDSLLAKVSWRDRRRRRLLWTMAAATAAAAAVVITVLVGIHPGPSVPSAAPPATSASALTMTPVAPNSIAATVTLISQGSGTRIEMICTYPKESDDNDVDKLAMVVVARDGSHTQLATWMAPPGVTVRPVGSTPMRMDQIAAVQIVSDDGDVLLQRNV
ncbi:MAG TPA: zf-HC2 domain-containing protein [Mycobacterium sp.]|uniref:anti-sigma factor family protein n=1 Tax=Mycobacterium sp. TaxID=1785 RepID=UPI002BA86E48|nr:zf-HC2 domain-containing protein [Mycobacterium sp.]HME76440.1 zf-HC2 domain-containing protein [Mycobacterium sp.]